MPTFRVWHSGVQELQNELPTPISLTCAGGCAVAGGIWCIPGLVFIGGLRLELPMRKLLACASGRTAAGAYGVCQVWRACVQELQCELATPTYLACASGRAVADGVWPTPVKINFNNSAILEIRPFNAGVGRSATKIARTTPHTSIEGADFKNDLLIEVNFVWGGWW